MSDIHALVGAYAVDALDVNALHNASPDTTPGGPPT